MSVPSDPLCGQVVDNRYRVIEPIAQGGFSKVYRARHEQTNAHVALKVLCRTDEQALRRFQQEAQTTTRVKHPAVVQIYDMAHLADGRPYIAMELLTGQTLRQLLTKMHRLAYPEAVRITRQIGAGLTELHKNNIVHRDVKPENIFLTRRHDGQSVIKQAVLLDLGLACVDASARLVQHTDEGVILGTASYLPPEAALGRTGLIDARSDQYALALVLREMLTGTSASPGKTRPDLPGYIHAALDKALEEVKDLRFPSVLDFLSALRDPAEPSTQSPAAGHASPHRAWLSGALLGIVASITVSLVGRTTLRRPAPLLLASEPHEYTPPPARAATRPPLPSRIPAAPPEPTVVKRIKEGKVQRPVASSFEERLEGLMHVE